MCSCGAQKPNGDTSDSTASTGSDSALPPVETKNPNTNYKPAFAGQTRVAGVKTKSAYETRVITSSLKSPWAIAVLPDKRLLINEKGGNILMVPVGSTGTAFPRRKR